MKHEIKACFLILYYTICAVMPISLYLKYDLLAANQNVLFSNYEISLNILLLLK